MCLWMPGSSLFGLADHGFGLSLFRRDIVGEGLLTGLESWYFCHEQDEPFQAVSSIATILGASPLCESELAEENLESKDADLGAYVRRARLSFPRGPGR